MTLSNKETKESPLSILADLIEQEYNTKKETNTMSYCDCPNCQELNRTATTIPETKDPSPIMVYLGTRLPYFAYGFIGTTITLYLVG